MKNEMTVYVVREKSSRKWVRTYKRMKFQNKGSARNAVQYIARINRQNISDYEVVEFKLIKGQVV